MRRIVPALPPPPAATVFTLHDKNTRVCSVFKCLPSKIKQRVLYILDQLMRRIVSALGGNEREDATFGRGSHHSLRASAIGKDGETGAPQGQAPLELRNAFQMTVYLLFAAAYPAEEVYSNSKQVRSGFFFGCVLSGTLDLFSLQLH